jgi:hypothetical protein
LPGLPTEITAAANVRIQSYRDLKVWEEGMGIAELCYRSTRCFPREELFGEAAQFAGRRLLCPRTSPRGMAEKPVANSSSSFA